MIVGCILRWEMAVISVPFIIFYLSQLQSKQTVFTLDYFKIAKYFIYSMFFASLILGANKYLSGKVVSFRGLEVFPLTKIVDYTRSLIYISAEKEVDLIPEQFKGGFLLSKSPRGALEFYQQFYEQFGGMWPGEILSIEEESWSPDKQEEFIRYARSIIYVKHIDTLIKVRLKNYAYRLRRKGHTYGRIDFEELQSKWKLGHLRYVEKPPTQSEWQKKFKVKLDGIFTTLNNYYIFSVQSVILFNLLAMIFTSIVARKELRAGDVSKPTLFAVMLGLTSTMFILLMILFTNGNFESRYFVIAKLFSVLPVLIVVGKYLDQRPPSLSTRDAHR
jgi:hypothetical protein